MDRGMDSPHGFPNKHKVCILIDWEGCGTSEVLTVVESWAPVEVGVELWPPTPRMRASEKVAGFDEEGMGILGFSTPPNGGRG